MTVNELVEMLKNYPGDMRVLTLGYEGGLNDIDVKWDNIVFDYNDKRAWYYGPHEYAKYAEDREIPGIECVIIGRDK